MTVVVLIVTLVITMTPAAFAGTSLTDNEKQTIETEPVQDGNAVKNEKTCKTATVKATAKNSGSAAGYLASMIQNGQPAEIDISQYRVSADTSSVKRLYEDMLNSNPQLFYVGSTVGWTQTSSGYVKTIDPQYKMSRSKIAAATKKFNSAVNDCIKTIAPGSNDMQKALQVHDYLVLNAKYMKCSMQQTAYGVLVDKKGVCQSYALAYEYIMNKLGIETTYIASSSMNHIWNMSKINGRWYQIDVTYDDPTSDKMGRVSHKYFMKSDSAMRSMGHSWNTKSYACSSGKYNNAFWKKVKTGVFKQGKYYYYVSPKGKLIRKTISSGRTKTIKLPKSRWYVWGSHSTYWNWTPTIAKGKKGIYVNTATGIYKVKGSKTKRVKKIRKSSKGYVYGIKIVKGKLTVAKSKNPNSHSAQKLSKIKGTY